MNNFLKKYGLWVLLGAVCLAIWFAPNASNTADLQVVKPVTKSGNNDPHFKKFEETDAIQVLGLKSRLPIAALENSHLFAATATPQPEVAPAPVEETPPEPVLQVVQPTAPALPFQFIGRYEQDGKTGVFLQSQQQALVVYQGDVIEQQYKVEKIDAVSMTLRYLPTNDLQILSIGAAGYEQSQSFP